MKKYLLLLMIFITAFVVTACDKAQGIDIAKIVFDIIGYIFTAIIGALGGAKVGVITTEKRIEKDPNNNYKRSNKNG